MILGHLWKYYSQEEYITQPESNKLKIWFAIYWKPKLKNYRM